MIAALLPPGLSGAELRDTGQKLDLHPGEEHHVARAAEKRRRDFSLGRSCARAALAPLGHGEAAISMGADGAPQWPSGILGSITHTSRYAAAVAGEANFFLGVGVDAERVGGVTHKLWPRLFNEAEQAHLAGRIDADVAATLLFSAKEAAFKAWRLRGALAFRDIAIALQEDGFTADHAGKQLRGRHAVEGELVLTLAWF
ncbi:MAG: 4'-phosphopantetheinyl transferase superfamily protein [Alphaproteobacteria bacterium]|nr:4'-phosphopantetheinyl transferase superfamily protein [Alphaproteobacteria bacterium]